MFSTFSFANFVEYTIVAPMRKVTAIAGIISVDFWRKRSYVMPIKAVGMVATTIRGISIPLSDLKSKCAKDTSMFFTSLRKKNTKTINVPKCKTRLNSGVTDKPKKYSVIFRWAVLEIGSHSDTPCISPRMIVWSSWSSIDFPTLRFWSPVGWMFQLIGFYAAKEPLVEV
jgi:hypothetical protein